MKEQTVSLGTKIMAANEKLTSINMIDLYEMISHPEPSKCYFTMFKYLCTRNKTKAISPHFCRRIAMYKI